MIYPLNSSIFQGTLSPRPPIYRGSALPRVYFHVLAGAFVHGEGRRNEKRASRLPDENGYRANFFFWKCAKINVRQCRWSKIIFRLRRAFVHMHRDNFTFIAPRSQFLDPPLFMLILSLYHSNLDNWDKHAPHWNVNNIIIHCSVFQ